MARAGEIDVAAPLNVFTVEVIGSALASIADEMCDALIRASYSPNVKERRDCSAAIFTTEGTVLAQAMHVPLHLGSLMRMIPAVVERYGDDISEGDVFIANDAYTGASTQLAEIVIAEPIHHGGRIVGWVANVAHHADLVDRTHAHIFQEGIRIPPIRLYRSGEVQRDLLDLILLNCQVPSERLGDLRAQMAADRRGIARFQRLCDRFTEDVVRRAGSALMDHAERQLRAGIAAIPDGEYTFRDTVEYGNGIALPIGVSIRIEAEEIRLDFSDCPAQVRGGINAPKAALLSSVYYAVKAIACPDAWPNAGLFRPIHVLTRPGTLVDSVAPAAVDDRIVTCQRVVDLIIGALSTAIPDRVMAPCGDNATIYMTGIDPRTSRYYVLLDVPAGGSGARRDRDGLDGVQVHLTNTSNLPVEALEQEYPVVVERYELVADSGGAGRSRGGLAVHRRIRAVGHEALVHVRKARRLARPSGLDGGGSGTLGVDTADAPSTQVDGREQIRLGPGQAVSVVTAGGGGYGPPRERDPGLLRRDVEEGRISAAAAERDYGRVTTAA